VDLVVERGSFHGVIGPNGAGKTTLVEIVQGVRRCEAGSVQLLGQAPLPRDPHLLARVGIQPQATAFFTRATVWEHLLTVASIFGASAARAEQLVELMGLGHVLKSRVEKLSGGERSLAAVALLVAIFKARPSPFYVMDEVEAALDDTNLGRLLEIFTELRQSSQLIIITHQKRTMEVADALYGITMRDGITKAVSQRLAQSDRGTAVTPDA